ncbi:MAG: HAD family hydrolase, partial [Bacteroidota bacterium]
MDLRVDHKTVIVFDLDDTLYNEMDYLRSAYRYIARELDSKNWERLFAKMFSLFRSREDVFQFVSETYKTDKSRLLEVYRGHKPNLSLFNGAHELIQDIKGKNGKLGIITDGRSSTQRTKISALGLSKIVDKIVISGEIGSEKPNETNYRIIEETFPGFDYIYIADNLRKDFITPNRLGWNSIGLVDNGSNMHFDGHLYFD